MFDQKPPWKYIYSVLSFILFFTILHIAVVALYNTYKTEDYRPLTISASENARSKPVKLIGDNTFNTTFTAIADNLGIISIRFNTTSQTKPGYILFRIKEVGAQSWYYSNTYKSDQFQNDGLFQMGFPPLYESKNRKYELEVKSLFGNNDNYLQISNMQFVPKFTFPRAELSTVAKLLQFAGDKFFSFGYNTSLLGWLLISLPLLITIAFYLLNKKQFITFFEHWAVLQSDIKHSLNLRSFMQWKRRNELILIVCYLFLIWLSIVQRYLAHSYQVLVQSLGFLSIVCILTYSLLHIKDKKAHWHITLVLLVYITLKAAFFDTEPKWDGRLYFGYMQQSFDAISPFLTNFSKVFAYVGHPAHGYATYLMIGRLLTSNPILSMHIMNTLLGIASLISIYAFLQKFYTMPRLNAALITGLFALNPLINAISLSPNLDYPVVCFFALALSLLVYDKILLAAFAFTLLAFSKETGLMLYIMFILLEIIFTFLKKSYIFNEYLARIVKSGQHVFFLLSGYITLLVTPIVLFALRYLLSAGETWKGNYYVYPEVPFLLHPDLLIQRLGQVFILNFQWLLIVAFLIIFLRSSKSLTRSNVFITTGIAYMIVMALYNTYVHPRYIAVLHFIVIIILASFVVADKRRKYPHFIFFILLYLLLIIQNFHPIDFVSNYYFGTFKWGNHKLLKLGDDLQSRCDGMVYNFQYTYIQKLYKKFHETTHGAYTVILSDVQNMRGSGNGWAHEYPHASYIEAKNLTVITQPGITYYLFLPWLTNNIDVSLPRIKKIYSIESEGIIEKDGYWLRFYKLTKRV